MPAGEFPSRGRGSSPTDHLLNSGRQNRLVSPCLEPCHSAHLSPVHVSCAKVGDSWRAGEGQGGDSWEGQGGEDWAGLILASGVWNCACGRSLLNDAFLPTFLPGTANPRTPVQQPPFRRPSHLQPLLVDESSPPRTQIT